MRIFSVFAGVIYVAAGSLCFVVTDYSFSSLAFPTGMLLLLAGLCTAGAYIASGKKHRLPDTVLVEGLVDAMFGFAVLNNQVSDAMLSMFFGSFTCIAGATRLSQAIDVSRYRPRDWARIMPLSVLTAILGVIMMMPRILLDASTMVLVGSSFILNGFSLLVYSMYMERKPASQKELEARERTDAKRAAREERSARRDRMRNMTRKERAEEQERIRQEKKDRKQAEKEARLLERELRRSGKTAQPDDTKTIQKDEAEAIRNLADTYGYSDQAVQQVAAVRAASDRAVHIEDEDETENPAVSAEQSREDLDVTGRRGWQKPISIPSVRTGFAAQQQQTETQQPRVSAVNLKALEKEDYHVEFEKPVLTEVVLAKDNAAPVDRSSILAELDTPVQQSDSFADYVPLRVEELITETLPKFDLEDPDNARFTERMSFTWGMHPITDEDIARYSKKK